MILETIEEGLEHCNKFREPIKEAERCVIEEARKLHKSEREFDKEWHLGRMNYWVQVLNEIKNED